MGDGLDIVRDMHPGSIDVAFGPHVGDWLMLGATLLSVAAASWLGYQAHRNGKRATAIAEESELARARELENARAERAEAAAARQEFEKGLRLDDAISEFFLAASRYIDELKRWFDECDAMPAGYSGNPDLLDYPAEPSQHALNAALENMILRAGPDESRPYEYLRGLFREILGLAPYKRVKPIDEIVTYVSLYRSGQISSAEFIDRCEAVVWGTHSAGPTPPHELIAAVRAAEQSDEGA